MLPGSCPSGVLFIIFVSSSLVQHRSTRSVFTIVGFTELTRIWKYKIQRKLYIVVMFQGGTSFVDLLWVFFFCLVSVMFLCASVYMCFVVTCWGRADLLALVCGV